MKKLLFMLLLPAMLYAQHPYYGIVIRDSSSFNYYMQLAEAAPTTEFRLTIVNSIVYRVADTVPKNITLSFERDGYLAGNSNTLTISGKVDAGLYKIFDSTISIKFDTGSVAIVYPEWWGIDGVADEVEFNAMWESLPEGRKGRIKLTGDYYFTDTWRLTQDASNDSVGTQACYIDGYGSCIWSEADTTIYVELGYLGQSELIHKMSGVRIKGNGHEGGQDDRDEGTNIGVYVRDTGRFMIENCSLRNLGIAVQVSHFGPGWQAPFCDGLRILYNDITCCKSGIVFTQDDIANPGTYANFDNSVIEGNRISANSNSYADACIKLSDYVIMSRSSFTKNMVFPYDKASAFYLGGGLGGSVIDLWAEGDGEYLFYISATWYEPTVTDPTTSYTPYNVTVTHRSGVGVADVLNLSNYRFVYKKTTLSEGFGGYAFRDWTHNVPPMQLKTVSATAGYMQGARVMYNFQNIQSNDTLVTDVSGNWVMLRRNEGTDIGTVAGTGWGLIQFDGVTEFATTNAYKSNGSVMYIAAIIPGTAYNSANRERVFKWFDGNNDYISLDYANAADSIFMDVETATGRSSITVSEAFSANTPLVFACIVDTVISKIELWLNGHLLGDSVLVGTIGSIDGYCAIGAEWGGATLQTKEDFGFFAVYPYVNRTVLEEISKSLLAVLNSDEFEIGSFTTTADIVVGTKAVVNDSLEINSSGAWIRKTFWSVTGDSLGIISYNTISSKLDTAWAVTK